MRILQIAGSLEAEAAGPSYSVPNLARSLAESGHQVDLFSLGPPGETMVGSFQHLRFAASFQQLPMSEKLGYSHSMKKALASIAGGAQVLHSHGLWQMPTVLSANAARPVGASFVVSPRGMFAPPALARSVTQKRLFGFLFQANALRSVALFHATSPQERDDIRAAGFDQPVAVVSNGIDVPPLAASKNLSTKNTILFFGRIHPIKQVENLIQAWALLESGNPGWRLEIRGPGETAYVDHLKQLARSLSLSNCSFEPALFGEEKLEAYRAAALCVLPSASENFGMTVAESLAAGTPVIATDGTPWQGLASNGCGWWVGQGPQPLATAMRAAMAMPDDALLAMGRLGREWMLRDFSWSAVARDMLAAYSWLRQGGEKPSFVFV